MKHLTLILFLLPFQILAQIKGQIFSAGDKKPVPFAAVFINNSTIGTTSDEEGRFTLPQLSPGKHELIVSVLGFEKHLEVINAPVNQAFKIYLTEKSQELDMVLVKAFDKDGWMTWGKLFTECFIGTGTNASQTKLLNSKDLRFRHNKKEKILEVFAVAPLKIKNKALGYDLEYHLEVFRVDFNNNTQLYAGYPFFKEPSKLSKKQKERRQASYDASLTKFLKSLYHNKLQEDGYLVRKLVEVPNREKQRVRALYDKYTIRGFDENGSSFIISGPNLPQEIYTPDSLSYFQKILAQPNGTKNLYKDTLSRSQILKRDTKGNKYIQFRDYLHIVNTKHLEDPLYLSFNRESRTVGPQTSMLKMTEDEPIEIQENGNYFPPLNLISIDYWGWSNKIADLLPLDYKSSTP
ncbi:hypothetical protein Lbys_2277 [Leadbetterella byssophila DSM 17132]|uniref:Carboxypeptidase-like regulatory domain-containing protein n=1 Tax=Leadbetterella byssophila (strain DSM 17132 / JCM 16389 / KACC 11308 / NBRC 106382 / 4M15) TaxID=649349 RepID=E4RVQ5_LEAB4|nr:carboxypeptidase-like regulatory domain-containing protein [Leadbetterella byssophila]ADQ17954.1 hypothetical protein Lbys_2277 [Leadbetterella byssophila DSM 17132]